MRGIRTAAWLFPAYLVLINLFVAPLAIAGLKAFPDGSINRDLTVLALPLNAGAHGLALLDDGWRPLGGDRNGRGRERRARDHHFQRSRDAARAPAPWRAGARGRGRHRRAGALGPPDRDRRRPGAWLRLRAHGRRSGSGVDRPVVVRGRGADRAGLSRRPLLAARDGAGSHRRHDRGRARLVLPLAPALDPARSGALGLFGAWAAGDRMAEPRRARLLRAQRAGGRRGPVARRQYRGVCRLFVDPPAERARTRPGERVRRSGRRRQASGVPPLAFVDDRRANSRRPSRAISGRVGRAAPSPASCASAASFTTRRSRPARNSFATRNSCSRRRSALRRRGRCCRCS